MKGWILVLCVLCGTAAAGSWPAQVPTGWVERDDLEKAQLAALPTQPQFKNIEVSVFESPASGARLTLATFAIALENGSRQQIEDFDRGMVRGTSQAADRHVSDSRHLDGNRIFGSSVDEIRGVRVHYERIYQVDHDDLVHMVMAICTAPPAAISSCEDVQKTLHLDLADAASIKNDESFAYKLGYAFGGVLAVAGLIALIRRLR